MATIEKSIDVNAPVRQVYNQWTQFEDFPRFMDGVERVAQLEDDRLHWKANVYGQDEEWFAVITEQIPDKRIAWRSTSGASNAGVVTFHYIDDETTRIMLQLEYEPEGLVENIGDWLGLQAQRIEGDLHRFKKFIEYRDSATGAWRGEIEQDSTE